MLTFREVLEDYGADYEKTMERFMHSESMYLRLMDMLFQDKNLNLLEESLNAGDLDAAFEAAHTLKGVAANMGLTPLFDAVCAVVEPLRMREARDDYPQRLEKIKAEFQRLPELREKLKKAAG